MNRALLIAVALKNEAKIVSSLLDKKQTIDGYPVDVIVTSMGPVASYKAALAEIDPAKHAGVLVLGFCGGLSLTLKPGDTVVATKLIGTGDGVEPFIADPDLCEALGKALISEGCNYRAVPLITHNKVIESTADKARFFERTKAEAVDMESYAIATAAKEKNLPCAVLKAVVDDAETELPNFNDYLDHEGKLDQIAFRQVLLNHPTLAMQLTKYTKMARVVLEKCIPSVVPVVCRKWKIEKRG